MTHAQTATERERQIAALAYIHGGAENEVYVLRERCGELEATVARLRLALGVVLALVGGVVVAMLVRA